MAETASFVYNSSAMESLKLDLSKIQNATEASLDDLKGQKTVAEATLAEATTTYNKEKAIYEAAMVKYRQALASYEEALESYKKAMSEFSKYTPPNPIPEGYKPPTPPTPPTPPVEPTPPSPDAMNAAKAALAAVEQSIKQVENDLECLSALVSTIANIGNQVQETDMEAVHILTNDFFKLWEFSGTQTTGNAVANAIVNNSTAVKDGYDYINTDNGRLYLDLFADEKLNMPQFIELGKTIGTTALITLMQKQGWGAEAIYHAAHTVDETIEYAQVKSTFNDLANGNRQSPIHADQSSSAQINNAMGSMDEDVTVFVDGKMRGGSFTTDDGTISVKVQGATLDVTTDNIQYTVVSDAEYAANYEKYKGTPVITESQFDRMVSIMMHEQGLKDDEYLAIATVFANNMESSLINIKDSSGKWRSCNYDADEWFQFACEPYDEDGKLYTSAITDSNGNYTGNSAKAAAALMDVLNGKRVFSSDVLYWHGDGIGNNMFCTSANGVGVWSTASI